MISAFFCSCEKYRLLIFLNDLKWFQEIYHFCFMILNKIQKFLLKKSQIFIPECTYFMYSKIYILFVSSSSSGFMNIERIYVSFLCIVSVCLFLLLFKKLIHKLRYSFVSAIRTTFKTSL